MSAFVRPLVEGVDFQGIVVGSPGSGKSTLQRALARRFVAAGGFVLAHDRTRDWANDWGVPAMKSADEYRAAVAVGKVPRVVSCQFPASDLTTLATDLGERWNVKARVRFPMLLAFDEATLLDGSGATHQGQGDRELTAIRRHCGIAVAWNSQRVEQLPVPFWALASDVYAFAIADLREIAALESRCGQPAGSLAWVRQLPRFRHCHIRRSADGGVVSDPL